MTKPMLYEPFVAEFTGKLVTFSAKNGQSYTFHEPFPQVEIHDPFMIEINPNTNRARLVRVVMPSGRIH